MSNSPLWCRTKRALDSYWTWLTRPGHLFALPASPPARGRQVRVRGEYSMRRHMGWSTLIGLLVILGLVGVAAIQQPRYGGTLRMVWEQDVTGFDPHWSPGLQVHYSVGNLFNSLVTIDEHLNDISELAESWGVQDNGNVYVFQLLKGVKFHDGSDIEAA